MRHTHVLICQTDEQTPDLLTEIATFALPTPDLAALPPETVLDTLETTTQMTGNAILRRLLQVQWAAVDALLVEQHCQRMVPAIVAKDGHKSIIVASRFGKLGLERQICVDPLTQVHSMPGNAVLPPHHGMIITRGLQAWACLLTQELSFAPVARLLGWQTHEEKILSATTLRSLVRRHGRLLQQVETAEVVALQQRDDLASLMPQVVPTSTPRRRAGWPAELGEAVDLALAAGAEHPPQGILHADWERVLQARRQEADLCGEDLRHLGPMLEPEQVLLTVDEILTPTGGSTTSGRSAQRA